MVAIHREAHSNQWIPYFQSFVAAILRCARNAPRRDNVIDEWVVVPLCYLMAERIDILNGNPEHARIIVCAPCVGLDDRFTLSVGRWQCVVIANDTALAGITLIQEGIGGQENGECLRTQSQAGDQTLDLG